MSVTRRQFLLSTAGASVGAIIPSFYFRALEFFEQFEEPLLEAPGHVTQELCVVDNFGEFLELSWGDPYADFPPLTFREYFTRYDPDGLGSFEECWGLPQATDTRPGNGHPGSDRLFLVSSKRSPELFDPYWSAK